MGGCLCGCGWFFLLLPDIIFMYYIKAFFVLLFCVVFSTCSFSQVDFSKDDSLARELVKKHIALNSVKQTVPGYRVQLFFGGQRERAYEMRSEFLRLFPGSSSYVVYHQPNFKLRVGDCRTRLEAMKLLQEVKPYFEGAFIVKDEVKL